MGLARHVALMDKIKNTLGGLIGKYEGKEVLLGEPICRSDEYTRGA
jgi:hypothetical protein